MSRISSGNAPADGREIRALTGIRGIAASWVLLFHLFTVWVVLAPSIQGCVRLAHYGWLGVDVFFVLSGFILNYVYHCRDAKLGFSEYLEFLWFRVARVYPNHVATLIGLFLLAACAHMLGMQITGDYPLSGLPFQLLMVHIWPYVHGGAWNDPSWSISAEWFAYLFIFPITWYLLRKRFKAVGFLAAGYAFLLIWVTVDHLWALKSFRSLVYVSCEFLAGGMFFGAYRYSAVFTGLCQRFATAVFAAMLCTVCFAPLTWPFTAPAIILMTPLLLVGLTSEKSLIAKFLCLPPMLWLGRVSYALYMSHRLAHKVIKFALPAAKYAHSSIALRTAVLFGQFLIIAAFAVALYYLVEVSSRNLLRRIASRRGRPAT
jgi:peptidoglycan/LPS O-acetylase OafA/YrhL